MTDPFKTDPFDTPGMGHNMPPDDPETLSQRLRSEHADQLDRATALMDKAPELIGDDAAAETAQDLIKAMRACKENLDDDRKRAKAPHDELVKAVQGTFQPAINQLAATMDDLNVALSAYDDANEIAGPVRSDLGTTRSVSRPWGFEVVDAKKIPLAVLRPYFDKPAIEKAIRAYLKAGTAINNDPEKQAKHFARLKGVTFKRTGKTVVR